MNALLVLLILAVGMSFPVQAGLNSEFRLHVGHPLLAATLNFAVGLGALLLATVVLRVPLPSASRLGGAPWWSWLGGLCGASLVLSAVIAAPRLGASVLVACLVAGQLAGATLIDHFGWLGYAVKPFTLARLLGVTLLSLGVLLIQRSGAQ